MSTSNTSSYKKLFSNTIIFAIGSFSSKILTLLLMPLYSHYITDADLGGVDVLTQIANWTIPLATMTIAEAVIRFGLDKAYDKKRLFTIGNIICGIGLLIFSLVLALVSISGIADNYIGGYSIILFLYVFMSSLKTLYTTFVRAMEKVRLFALSGIVATFFTVLFTALFLVLTPNIFGGSGIAKYLVPIALADFVTIIFVTFKAKLWKYIDFSYIDREMLDSMLRYSIPLIPAQLLWLITNSSDSFMTTHYLGKAANGTLSFAYKIPNFIATVYMMFGQAWNMSAITEHDSDHESKFYEKVFDFNQSLLYILVGGCLLIIQPMTKLLIHGNVQECIKYSPLIAYSTIFSCFTTFMGSIYLATKQTKRSMFTSLVSGVINVGLNVILIPTIGLYGPAVSTVVSYVTVFSIRAFDSRTLVPFKINIKKLLISNAILLAMVAVTLKFTDLMKEPLMYLVLFGLFSAVFVINMKDIGSLFYRFLPKKIADIIVKIKISWFALGIAAFISFLIINCFTMFIPLLIIAAAAFVFGVYRNKILLCLPAEIMLLAYLGAAKWTYAAFIILIALAVLRKFKYNKLTLNLCLYAVLVYIACGFAALSFTVLCAAALAAAGKAKEIYRLIGEYVYKKD